MAKILRASQRTFAEEFLSVATHAIFSSSSQSLAAASIARGHQRLVGLRKTIAFPRLILLDQGDNKNSTKLYVSFLLAFILSEMWTPEPANDSDP
ncbi:hypothetical protein [Mesorhizobium caraganae]|uniref:hypothetical protein n=1 Tax=Mesorhizobium caraganae TaxID=483206 RepID=UPI00333C282B